MDKDAKWTIGIDDFGLPEQRKIGDTLHELGIDYRRTSSLALSESYDLGPLVFELITKKDLWLDVFGVSVIGIASIAGAAYTKKFAEVFAEDHATRLKNFMSTVSTRVNVAAVLTFLKMIKDVAIEPKRSGRLSLNFTVDAFQLDIPFDDDPELIGEKLVRLTDAMEAIASAMRTIRPRLTPFQYATANVGADGFDVTWLDKSLGVRMRQRFDLAGAPLDQPHILND